MPTSPPPTARRRLLFTDGGARPNPGPGGWAAVIVDPATGETVEIAGGELQTTNNRMELLAAIRALEAQPTGSDLEVYTDSRYVRQGITLWLPRWIRRGWRRPDDQEVKNRDLWQRLAEQESRHRVRWHWVRGHTGHEHNERADALATEQIAALVSSTPERQSSTGDLPAGPRPDADGYLKVRCAGGRGQWVALLVRDQEQSQLSGRDADTTANRLELVAGLSLLRACPRDAVLALHAGDYLRRGASEWMPAWKRSGWRTGEGQPVKNVDLWRQLDSELRERRVLWLPSATDEMAKELATRLLEMS